MNTDGNSFQINPQDSNLQWNTYTTCALCGQSVLSGYTHYCSMWSVPQPSVLSLLIEIRDLLKASLVPSELAVAVAQADGDPYHDEGNGTNHRISQCGILCVGDRTAFTPESGHMCCGSYKTFAVEYCPTCGPKVR